MTRTLLLAGLSLLVVAAIIMNPGEAFQASLQGLTVWWNIVFPGLLPFLTLFELLLAFGAVHGLGTLLDPVMRRVFRLPGEAGLAIAFGWGGGFPAGADATAQLRKRAAVSKSEGERLLALSHMPNPLFVLLVVGAGFLHRPELGIAILLILWTSGLLAGFFIGRWSGVKTAPKEDAAKHGLLRSAARAMMDAKQKDGRTLGKVLGDAVTASVAKLMSVGGFMMLGAVAVSLLSPIFQNLLPSVLLPALVESHIGAYAAATAEWPDAAWIAAAIAATLSFGGLTAILQAGSSVSGTDMRLVYLWATRLVQAAIAFGLSLVAAQPVATWLKSLFTKAAPAMLQTDSWQSPAPIRISELPTLWPSASSSLFIPCALIVLLAAISYRARHTERK